MKLALLFALNILLIPAYVALYILAFSVTFFPVFPCRTGLANLKERLGSGFFRAHFQLAAVFLNYIFYAVETLIIWPLGLTSVKHSAEMREFLRQTFAKYEVRKGTGIIFLSGHFGNIESIGQIVTETIGRDFERELYALAQPSHSGIITRILSWYRKKRGIPTLMTGDKNLFTAMRTALRQGASLALLADQKPRRNGFFVEFFGAPAAFPYRGIEFGVDESAPFMYMMAKRVIPGYFEPLYAEGVNTHLAPFCGGDPIRVNTRVRSSVVCASECQPRISTHSANIIAGYAGWLEELIKNDPLQWFWDYKKWSRKPTP